MLVAYGSYHQVCKAFIYMYIKNNYENLFSQNYFDIE